jgi:dissimilatory sulfite reductase (desulfoviridin) alpha/beta subunit
MRKYYRQIKPVKPSEKYKDILKWLDEVLEMEENEAAKYSTTVILTEARQGYEKEFEKYKRKIKLLRAARYELSGGKLLRKP